MNWAIGLCPVCGMEYYDKRVSELDGKEQVRNYASNATFAECTRITRVADDTEPWKAESFGHTAQQTFNMRGDNEYDY